MGKRPSLVCFIVLLIAATTEISLASEKEENTLSARSDINNNPAIEQEEADKETPSENVTNVTEANEKHSIKMIVGGDSKGGVAKQLIVPVKN